MIRTLNFTQGLLDACDPALVGGKATNLGRLIRAGFPVPGGFVVNTRAYHAALEQCGDTDTSTPAVLPSEVADEIRDAYHAMGRGTVAVRSSATAEDMGDASMAGQYETFLDIDGEDNLLDAVRRCWSSLDSPRTSAYLKEHQIDPSNVAMAVVVQRLVAADTAGVLFTVNPNAVAENEMLLEASWGLGESVVSGRVQPDVLRIEIATGRVLSAKISDKQVHLTAGSHEMQPVDESRRQASCLRGLDVHRLWQLGRRTAEFFGAPQDVEWAILDGELFLLQSRPITTGGGAASIDQAEVWRAARRQLQDQADAGRGPWVVHNLAETLPRPTPLTWSILQPFMSGAGGFGAMYRMAGFVPSPAACQNGFLELIGGRVYMDAARAPEMFFENFPFAYDSEELRRSPDASQKPPTMPRGILISRIKAARCLRRVTSRLRGLSVNLDAELRETLFPAIRQYVTAEKKQDLAALDVDQLLELWRDRQEQILDIFAPQTLMPSLISGLALEELRTFIEENFWNDDAEARAQQISSGGLANRTLLADAELYEVVQGNRPLEMWIAEHGHRASGEFDLAAPRWRQLPAAVRELAANLTSGASPLELHRRRSDLVNEQIESMRKRLSSVDRGEFDHRIDLVRRYVCFREDGKDFFMLAYDLLRDLALEAGRRLDIGEDIFYLTRDEMVEALRVGFATYHLIEQRKRVYEAEAHMTLPRVIGRGDIDALGQVAAPPLPNSDGYPAFAVSTGVATGAARILQSPLNAGALGKGYILVCPSTDPSWTPLFVNAAGLVLECGGALSHGAVVAREMGLPAVVLSDATRLFQNGDALYVDGHRGWVGPASEQKATVIVQDANAERSMARELIPPPAGRVEKKARKISGLCAVFWSVFLLAFFILPESWLHQPVMRAFDALLWPLIRMLGKPAVVAIVAVSVGLLTLLIQRFMTDNRRLLEAKGRANQLRRRASELAADSRQRAKFLRIAGAVPARTFMAALVPIGILLGPMVVSFVWLSLRVDPASWNALPGSSVQVVATVDSNWTQPVRIDVPPQVQVDKATPVARTLSPLRQTLERLLALYRQPRVDPTLPWELQIAPDVARQQTADDLQAYLNAGVPPQAVTWQIRPPENMNGRFPVTVTPAGGTPVTALVTIGDAFAPSPLTFTPNRDSPIKLLRVVYPPAKQAAVFWQPLAGLAGHHFPLFPWLSSVDIGWLWLYILTYIPVLMIVRALLKIA